MAKIKITITGATGNMGGPTLKALLGMPFDYELSIISHDTKWSRKFLKPYEKIPYVKVHYCDLRDYEGVKEAVRGADIVLHIGALVSPMADDQPLAAMQVNYGGTLNLIKAIKSLGQSKKTAFVYIGTVAETGDRMPPIHWGRVGDPIKPSLYDYYAVSKVAAERAVIESGLSRWVSLRQTGIISKGMMASSDDPIIFHDAFNMAMEYVSDRDSALMMRNLCVFYANGTLRDGFWGHIYNVGGGESCRMDTYTLYQEAFKKVGIKNLGLIFSPKYQATRNFHGQYYLDSDKLEDYLHFRHDGIDYFYQCFKDQYGTVGTIGRGLSHIPGGERLLAAITRSVLKKTSRDPKRGTRGFFERNDETAISAFFGSKEAWERLPEKMEDFERWGDYSKVIRIDHGYDESRPENELDIEDLRQAAKFRGGALLSDHMEKGDWKTPLTWKCAFGHTFKASPRLVLEGGHWCDACERDSWNYAERAKADPFFAQVWDPLHEPTDKAYLKKDVSELDVSRPWK
jgi:nucleoside-diphosphate-sugar epimerase